MIRVVELVQQVVELVQQRPRPEQEQIRNGRRQISGGCIEGPHARGRDRRFSVLCPIWIPKSPSSPETETLRPHRACGWLPDPGDKLPEVR